MSKLIKLLKRPTNFMEKRSSPLQEYCYLLEQQWTRQILKSSDDISVITATSPDLDTTTGVQENAKSQP